MAIKNSLIFIALLFCCTVNTVFANAVVPDVVNKVPEKLYPDLATARWLHGSKSCRKDTNPPIQVMQADASTYVLRQNKCVTFEAPFIYVLFGKEKILVVDTGANQSPDESPVFKTVQLLIDQQQSLNLSSAKEILVVHSHSHSDHTKGDSQFIGRPGIEVVGTDSESLFRQLGLVDWPNRQSTIDLGGRVITFIPIPGHQEQSIAIYDDQTDWLLTGDSLYPGSIRVKNWDIYKRSIQRLFEFSQSKPVALLLGAHIEFNAKTKKLYRIGKTFQPHESPLGLHINQLAILNQTLQATPKAQKLNFESFVIAPLSRFEKMIINALSRN